MVSKIHEMAHAYGVRMSGNVVEFKMYCQSQVKSISSTSGMMASALEREHFWERTVYLNPVLDLSHIYSMWKTKDIGQP